MVAKGKGRPKGKSKVAALKSKATGAKAKVSRGKGKKLPKDIGISPKPTEVIPKPKGKKGVGKAKGSGLKPSAAAKINAKRIILADDFKDLPLIDLLQIDGSEKKMHTKTFAALMRMISNFGVTIDELSALRKDDPGYLGRATALANKYDGAVARVSRVRDHLEARAEIISEEYLFNMMAYNGFKIEQEEAGLKVYLSEDTNRYVFINRLPKKEVSVQLYVNNESFGPSKETLVDSLVAFLLNLGKYEYDVTVRNKDGFLFEWTYPTHDEAVQDAIAEYSEAGGEKETSDLEALFLMERSFEDDNGVTVSITGPEEMSTKTAPKSKRGKPKGKKGKPSVASKAKVVKKSSKPQTIQKGGFDEPKLHWERLGFDPAVIDPIDPADERTNTEKLVAPLHDIRSIYGPDYIIIGTYALFQPETTNEGWLHLTASDVQEMLQASAPQFGEKVRLAGKIATKMPKPTMEVAFVVADRHEDEINETAEEIGLTIKDPQKHQHVLDAFLKIRSSDKLSVSDFQSEVIAFKNDNRGMTNMMTIMNVAAKKIGSSGPGAKAPSSMHTFSVDMRYDDPAPGDDEVRPGAALD